VKVDTVLARLLELRRLGEQRALERLIAREGDCRKAQQEVEKTADAALRQMAEARARERKEIESFGGKAMSQRALLRFYAKLDTMMVEQARLRTVEEKARNALRDSLEARVDAQRDFRARQRATIKLDEVVKQQSISSAFRQSALTEAAAEERVAGPPGSRSSDGHGA
jgi:hypothetical protein